MTVLPKAVPPPPTKVEFGTLQDADTVTIEKVNAPLEPVPTDAERKEALKTFFSQPAQSDAEYERVYGKPIQLTLPTEESEQVEQAVKKQEPPAEESLVDWQKRHKEAERKMHEATQEAAFWKKLAQDRPPIPSQIQAQPQPQVQLPDPSVDPEGFTKTVLSMVEQKSQQQRVEDWFNDHPEYVQYWDKMNEMSRTYRSLEKTTDPVGLLTDSLRLAKMHEKLEGEGLAEEDTKETIDRKVEAVLNQEAYKTSQGIRKPTASSKEPIIPDFDKMTSDERWTWLEAHPEYLPSSRIGQLQRQ